MLNLAVPLRLEVITSEGGGSLNPRLSESQLSFSAVNLSTKTHLVIVTMPVMLIVNVTMLMPQGVMEALMLVSLGEMQSSRPEDDTVAIRDGLMS